MTVANVYGLMIPQLPDSGGSLTPTLTNLLLDASGEKAAFVVRAPKTGAIRKVGFLARTVTTPTDTDVRIETVDLTTGFPSGTLFGTNTNVTVASGSITSNTWITSGALTADASVSRGDLLAVVIAPSGSPNYNVAAFLSSIYEFPYPLLYTTSYSKSSASPIVSLEYSDGSYAYIPGVTPCSTLTSTTFNSGSTPDERALKFRMAAPVRVAGVWAAIDLDNDAEIVLYDSDGSTALATVAMDKDVRRSTNSVYFHVQFASQVSLSASTYYYLAVKPGASSVTLQEFSVSAAGVLDQMAGGQDFHFASRTDAGSWSATTTTRPFMGLIIDGIDDGAGGGGSVAWIS